MSLLDRGWAEGDFMIDFLVLLAQETLSSILLFLPFACCEIETQFDSARYYFSRHIAWIYGEMGVELTTYVLTTLKESSKKLPQNGLTVFIVG